MAPIPQHTEAGLATEALHLRLLTVAQKLEDARLADSRELGAALTHRAIDAGELLMAAIDDGYLVVDANDEADLAKERDYHTTVQAIPSHRRSHASEEVAAFNDYRVMFFVRVAARRFGLVELTRIDTRGADNGQRRMMLAERARMLGHACRELSREVRANEHRIPLWLRGPALPRELVVEARRTLLTSPLGSPGAELHAALHFAQTAAQVVLAQLERRRSPGAREPLVLSQNIMFRLRSARDSIVSQFPPASLSVASARFDRLIDAVKVTLEAVASVPPARIMTKKSPKGGRKLRPGPWIAALKQTTEAADDVARLLPLSSGATQAASDDFKPASWFTEAYGKHMPARLRVAAGAIRRTKRVAKQKIDGVMCYSRSDAERWWGPPKYQ